jgi:hypothetical protein
MKKYHLFLMTWYDDHVIMIFQAACCQDKLHCCPGGTHCNLTSGYCEKKNQVYPVRLTSLIKKPKVDSIICPDQKSACPDGSTCCQLVSGDYGCCPMPDATCCSDHIHCCPQGYTCDIQSGSCNKGAITLPWVKKTRPKVHVTDITCQDQSSCPDNNTCCQLNTGRYMCCPLPNASCCFDRIHCCPGGYKCRPMEGICSKNTMQIPMTKVVRHTITCPDGKTRCKYGMKCCQTGPYQYTCCRQEAECSITCNLYKVSTLIQLYNSLYRDNSIGLGNFSHDFCPVPNTALIPPMSKT